MHRVLLIILIIAHLRSYAVFRWNIRPIQIIIMAPKIIQSMIFISKLTFGLEIPAST
jgi:hypothetical protein